MFAGVCLFCAYAACSSVICLFKCDYQLNYDFLRKKNMLKLSFYLQILLKNLGLLILTLGITSSVNKHCASCFTNFKVTTCDSVLMHDFHYYFSILLCITNKVKNVQSLVPYCNLREQLLIIILITGSKHLAHNHVVLCSRVIFAHMLHFVLLRS